MTNQNMQTERTQSNSRIEMAAQIENPIVVKFKLSSVVQCLSMCKEFLPKLICLRTPLNVRIV